MILHNVHTDTLNKENQLPKLNDKVESDDSLFSIENADDTSATITMDEEARFSEMLSTPSLRRHFLERVMLRTKDILECSTTKGKWAKLISCTSVFLQCK